MRFPTLIQSTCRGGVHKNSYGSTQDMINFTWMVGKIGQSNWYLNCNLKVGGWGCCLQIEKSRWRVFRREQVLHVQENEVTNVYAIHCCVTISGNCCKAIQSDMWLPVDVSEWMTFLWLSHPCSVSGIWFYTFSFFMFWILWKWALLMSRHSCSCNWLVRYLTYVNLSAVSVYSSEKCYCQTDEIVWFGVSWHYFPGD